MNGQQPTTSITIRIPADSAQMLRRLATQHDRSLTGEIVRALRQYAERHQDEQEP